MKNKVLASFALFLTALIWGLSFVAQRAGMEYVGPFTFNAVRSFLGTLSLIPVILWVKVSKPDTRTDRRRHYQHVNLARAGIGCGLALFTALTIQQYCMQYVNAGKAGFLTALYIVIVPIISILMGEKLTKKIIFSVILSVIGLYLLCFKAGVGFDVYDVFLLIGALFYGVHILVVGYYSKRVNFIKASCLQFFVVGVLSSILMLIFETPTIASILACKVPILYAGILTCGIAYTLQIFGQKYTNPVIASLIMCLESVFAVLGGCLILGEVLTLKETLGCVFMISGVVLSSLNFEKTEEK